MDGCGGATIITAITIVHLIIQIYLIHLHSSPDGFLNLHKSQPQCFTTAKCPPSRFSLKRSPAMVLSQPGPSTFTVMVSVWMEGIFYGMNTVVYFTCLCVIISRKARQDRKVNKGLLALSTLLFASATAHMAINIRRLIEGYIISPTKAAMDEYFGDIKQPLTAAHEFLLVTTYFFSDLILVCSLQPLSSAL